MKKRRDPNEKLLSAVRPNEGLRAAFRRKLVKLLREMHDSVAYWLEVEYRQNPPRMATDAMPAAELRKAVDQLRRRWSSKWDAAAPKLAQWFAQDVETRSSAQLAAILKQAGISIKFKMTPAMRDILEATTAQNVGLIKSIPSQYFTEIEGLVMRSVQTGRDLGTLTKDLQERYGVSFRRAALIARDQNNKATASMTRARQAEIGIDEAIWLHSGGGREPRPTHVANSGKRYKVSEGWYDPAVKKYIFPGELINCRCVSKSVVRGFS